MDLKIIRNKLVGNDQERAVSPVIGVILMVAITVILAAVIAAFVMDMGPGDSTAPSSQVDVDSDSSWDLNDSNTHEPFGAVSHGGGDSIDHDELIVDVRIEGTYTGTVAASDDWLENEVRLDSNNNFADSGIELDTSGDTLGVGDNYDLKVTTTYTDNDDGVSDGTAEVTIIHGPSDSIVDETTIELNDWKNEP